MRIWLGRGVLPNGRKHMNVGLNIYGDGGKEEVRKVIEIIHESLAKHFPDAQILRYGKAKEVILY